MNGAGMRPEIVHAVRCDGNRGARTLAGLHAHALQTHPAIALRGEETYRAWWATEWFRSADRQPDLAAGRRAA